MSRLSYKIKQALEEADEMCHPDKKPSLIVKWSRFVRYFVTDLYYDYPYLWVSRVKSIHKNIKFFWPHIKHMRDWDSSYQIYLFCDSLEYLAQGLKNHDNCLHSLRHYRRCLFAAKRLRNAYDDKAHEDKSYQRLSMRNPIRFVKLSNGRGSQMTHDYGNTEEYYTKMFKVIHKRTEASMKAEKEATWMYINKHIQSWWD